jgi:hypothetical protein
MDLESCTVAPGTHAAILIALGSGSNGRRERVILVARAESASSCGRRALYAMLRATTDFAGSELNIEGAVYREGGSGCSSGAMVSAATDWIR